MLSALGLHPVEEEIYRRLITHVTATVDELAMLTGREPGEVMTVLADLASRGLTVADPSGSDLAPTTEFSAAPPAVALGALLRQRRDDLGSAEQDVTALIEEHRVASIDRKPSDAVEVITDISAVRHRFAQIQEAARHEVLSMVTPNLTVVPHRDNVAEVAGLHRGVRYRVILDRAALVQPEMMQDVISSIAAGQEIRVIDKVPTKLFIVDGELAMLPLHRRVNTAASMLVQSCGLLDALIALFEALWDQAYPLLPNATGDGLVETRRDLDEIDTQILALLLTGMTDAAVAGQLGTSRRTVQRRIHELMVKAGAETRIELGWYAAHKGWA